MTAEPAPSSIGRLAVVTGACRPPGIGWHVATGLADDGFDLVLVDRVGDRGDATDVAAPATVARLVETVEATGARCLHLDLDLRDPSAADTLVTTAVERFGRIDAGFCLDGISGPDAGLGDLVDLEPNSWRRCLETNLDLPYLVTRALARHMIDRGGGGSICLLSSYAARQPAPGAAAIGVARAGLEFLVEALAVELGPHGIRVNAVAPLGVEASSSEFANTGLAELIDRMSDGGDRELWARKAIPLGRLQQAEETAAIARFLADDEASFVSGQTVAVAGGAPG